MKGTRRFRQLAGVIACLLVVCSTLAAVAAASPPGTFEARSTEDFPSLTWSCPEGVDPVVIDTCGTVKTQRFGKATVGTVIDAFFPISPGCFRDDHTHTLRFKRGDTLVISVVGIICVGPSGPPNFTYTGTYTVIGGTGIFAGATGTGTQTAFRDNGPIHAELSGTLVVAND